jgi:hypothetical protein
MSQVDGTSEWVVPLLVRRESHSEIPGMLVWVIEYSCEAHLVGVGRLSGIVGESHELRVIESCEAVSAGLGPGVTSPGYDCKTDPAGIASPTDWTKGCVTAQNFLNIHDTTGHFPTSTPTTYPGDP